MVQRENKVRLWHHCFGHLNVQSMQKLVKRNLVNHLDCDTTGKVGVCKACLGEKQSKNSFSLSETAITMPLELVHSDVCGKMGQKSLYEEQSTS